MAITGISAKEVVKEIGYIVLVRYVRVRNVDSFECGGVGSVIST